MPEPNVGTVDRAIRAILGLILAILGMGPLGGMQNTVLGLAVALIGVAVLFTAASGFCLIYHLLGISTEKK